MNKEKLEKSTAAATLLVRIIGYSLLLILVAFVGWRIYTLSR